MLDKLQITRFKSIQSLALEFGNVNLFIGGNGAGKSNILEAIGLAAACLGRGLGDSDIANKGLRVTPPELMKSSFKNENLPRTLQLDATMGGNIVYSAVLSSRSSDPFLRFFSESCKHSGEPVFGRSQRGARATGVSHESRLDPYRGIWDQIKATYEISDDVSDALAEFSRYQIYSPQTDFLRGRKRGTVNTPPIGLHGEGVPEAVSSILVQLHSLRRKLNKRPDDETTSTALRLLENCLDLVWLPGWASQVSVARPKPSLTSRDMEDRSGEMVYFLDRFMHQKRNKLSVYDSSEGTLFLLFSAIILADKQAPRIFALDNVDSALNPQLTKKLVEKIIFVTKNSLMKNSPKFGAKQVFLTSHNPTAIDAFDLFDDTLRVFVVKRNNQGQTTAERLEPPHGMSRQDWVVAKGGRNLSQLWLDGEIGGALGEL
jgi:hypothetical protein